MLIFITGYMGSGKTTLGRILAEKTGSRFIDMDEFFEDLSGYSVEEFFSLFGEDSFREKERDLLHLILDEKDAVISTGGGTPCHFDNLERMKEAGRTVYLRCPPSVLWRRLLDSAHQRPLLKSVASSELLRFITDHLSAREKYYLRSQTIIDTGENQAEEIAEIILSEMQGQ